MYQEKGEETRRSSEVSRGDERLGFKVEWQHGAPDDPSDDDHLFLVNLLATVVFQKVID